MPDAARLQSMDEIRHALHAVASDAQARTLIDRAMRVAGIRRAKHLAAEELLMLCAALAAEGGHIEQIAADLARRALDEPTRGGRPPRR